MKKVREGYKMTELGEIPEEWYISKLSELAQIKRGASPRPINNPKWFSENKNVGWIRISDVTKTKKYLNSTEQYLSDEGVAKSRLVKPNDLIMSICATVGKPIILNMDACIHDGFILFDNLNNNKIITDYLYYLLQKKEEEFKGMGQTGTQANLNTNIVGSTLIAIPTIKEQEKIAFILSTVDEQIDNVDTLIEKNKELKKGLMQTLLTKGIGHKKFKRTEIGEIPEDWQICELRKIFSINTKLVNPNKLDEEILHYSLPAFDDGKEPKRQNSLEIKSSKYLIEEDSILVSKLNPRIKRVWLVNNNDFIKQVCSTEFINYVPINKSNTKLKYFMQYFNSDIFQQELLNRESGSTGSRKRVTPNSTNDIKIAIPNSCEQEKIALILIKIDEKIESYENKKQSLEELKKGLMQKLLTGNIRSI